MMLAPVLVVLSIVLARRDPSSGANGEKRKITIPWFAFLFLAVIGFNSLHLLPAGLVDAINTPGYIPADHGDDGPGRGIQL